MSLDNEQLTFLQTHRVVAQEQLLAWFAQHARDLPWRHDRTPYRVWVAEVMLQQTQVTKVQDYYERFMARFPTVTALAEAPLEDVLKQWEGLGYYSRARALHRAAQDVIAEYDGDLPAGVDALRRLPGIGAYTAGAIASIAFGIPAPAVDGNVRRVMARVLAWAEPDAAGLETAVRVWLPADAPGVPGTPGLPGAFTEALMELGATLCRPKSPQCLLCPWRDLCSACALGQSEAFPYPNPASRFRITMSPPPSPSATMGACSWRAAVRRTCSVGCGSSPAGNAKTAKRWPPPCAARCRKRWASRWQLANRLS